MMDNIKHIIESLLFVAEEPLTVDRLKKTLDNDDTEEIRTTLRTLGEEYDARNGGFYLRQVAGGYQLRTRPEYNQWVKKLLQPKPPRLSKAALETLAIVAYKQPIIRSNIEHIRGVDCGGLLRMLLERNMIRVLGRKEIPGRPLIYGTTKHFLEVFDLKDLKDLPTPKEIEELTGSDSVQASADNSDRASDDAVLSPVEDPMPDSDRNSAQNGGSDDEPDHKISDSIQGDQPLADPSEVGN